MNKTVFEMTILIFASGVSKKKTSRHQKQEVNKGRLN